MTPDELFAFEVPSIAGTFRIVGPANLTADEAEKVGSLIHRLIPLLVVEPEPVSERPCTYHHPYGPLCGLREDHALHVREGDRMRAGAHVFRDEPVRRKEPAA